jgi:aminocarboxymuconate-semialdehyde decarboxylase
LNHLPDGMSPTALRCHSGIDIHAHIVPAEFPARLSAAGLSTAAAPDLNGCCHRHVLVHGKHYRTVSDKCWSAARRIGDFDDMGLSRQVVSPMPELLSYWLDSNVAQPLVRYLNEQTAAICSESSGRLLGFAAVPMQDIDAAIAELRHAIEVLGLVGVEVGSNINGVPIGDLRFEPFFATCVAMDVPVFVHALKPAGMDRLVGPPSLQQVLAYPTDVGLAAASVITSGLLQRLPGLRMAFSHGGGTLMALLPRLQQGWTSFAALADSIPQAPREQARRLYYDTLVFDAATLRHLHDSVGPQALMLGTDHPFNFHEPRPMARLAEAGFDTATQDALAFGNARRFLGAASAARLAPALESP